MINKKNEQNNCPIIQEMIKVLESMLMDGEKISARSMTKRLKTIKSYTSVTRNLNRKTLLEKYQERQKNYKQWEERDSKTSKANILIKLTEKESEITELENKVNNLTESHVLMIQAIGELGGYAKWSKFYEDYKEIKDKLPFKTSSSS